MSEAEKEEENPKAASVSHSSEHEMRPSFCTESNITICLL